MSFRSHSVLLLGAVVWMGCGGSRAVRPPGFSAVTPGMNSAELTATMGEGPTRAQEFQDGSVAWFYGSNRCVLLRNDVVVTKDRTTHERGVSTPWGSMSQEKPAQCAPAGERVDNTRTNIHTPLGTFQTQDAKTRKQATQSQP